MHFTTSVSDVLVSCESEDVGKRVAGKKKEDAAISPSWTATPPPEKMQIAQN